MLGDFPSEFVSTGMCLTFVTSLEAHMLKEMQTVTDHRIVRNTSVSTGSCAAGENPQTVRCAEGVTSTGAQGSEF